MLYKLKYQRVINYSVNTNYKWIKEFTIQYPVWNKDIIKARAKNMASLYFEKILSCKYF